jgi:putative restriction endonuclease
MNEDEIRVAAFLWLKEQSIINVGIFSHEQLVHGFAVQGQPIVLKGMTGIWFPKGFKMPISITTTTENPYQDDFDSEGFLDYRYRGTDPNHRDNQGLRLAYQTRTPLIYFHGIKPGKYQAVWPLFVLEDDPKGLRIRAALDPAYVATEFGLPVLGDDFDGVAGSAYGIRKYLTTLTQQRLHQTAFREFVLDAYSRQCSMCRLQHEELLDAAHIIPDSKKGGDPVVQNGLSLCKIHHAAYDRNIIGISPDYRVRVRSDVLEEIDGPMLRYGLQSLEGHSLTLPKKKSEYPDRDRLEVRFREFAS